MNGRNPHLPSPQCIVKVGGGRGFIIEHRVEIPKLLRLKLKALRQRKFTKRRLIVTAAHCLPNLPPPGGSLFEDRTFGKLLASLDGGETDVWAECLFADPVADIAVLDCVDEQSLSDEADAYHALTDERPVVRIDNAWSGPGWVLSLDGRWVRTNIVLCSGIWGASLEIDATDPGMSGSPILNDSGRAIGVVTIGTETIANGKRTNERAGPQPILMRDLPARLLLLERAATIGAR
jgi:hypothetical protein